MIQHSVRNTARVTWVPPCNVLRCASAMNNEVNTDFRGRINGCFADEERGADWRRLPTLSNPFESRNGVSRKSGLVFGSTFLSAIILISWGKASCWIFLIQKDLAESSSSGVIGVVNGDVLAPLNFFTARIHRLVIRNNRVRLEYLLIKSQGRLESLMVMSTCVERSSSGSSVKAVDSVGQLEFSSDSHGSPTHYNVCWWSCNGVKPRVPQSAGFSLPGTNFHTVCGKFSCI